MSELLKINVNEHTEKKGNLTYLSWAWAWAEVLKIDPQATWEAFEFDGFPVKIMPDNTAMVKTVVTIKGHAKTCWLPVMDHKNKAIVGPDAFAINTAIMRCLTKTISMHGLGLYIYAGEDLPEGETPPVITEEQAATLQALIDETKSNKADLLKWVSQNTNTDVKTLAQVPNVAYSHLVKLLEKKRAQA